MRSAREFEQSRMIIVFVYLSRYEAENCLQNSVKIDYFIFFVFCSCYNRFILPSTERVSMKSNQRQIDPEQIRRSLFTREGIKG